MTESNEIIKIADVHEKRIKSAEYPDTPSLIVKYLNQIFELTPKLLIIFTNIKSRIDPHG